MSCPLFIRPSVRLPTTKGKARSEGDQDAETAIRTLPALVDFNAAQNPNYLFCMQAQKNGDSSTPLLLPVSHSQFRDAVLRCQQWLEATVGEIRLPTTIEKGPPVALLMESDLGLLIHLVALLGMGVPALLLSARLSPMAIHKLLETTGTCAVLTSPRLSRNCREAIESLDEAHWAGCYERQPYTKFLAQDDAETLGGSVCRPHYHTNEVDRRVIILHSSGTTGLPKAIYQSHEYLVGFASCHDLASAEAECRNLSTLPLYHGFGLLAPGLSLTVGLTMCLPVNSISSAPAVVELIRMTKARSMMTVPSVLGDLSQLEDGSGIQALLPLQFVAVGGGPLPTVVGDRLVQEGVSILNHFGVTEVGPLAPIFVPKRNYDHHYFRLRQDFDFDVVPVEDEADEGRERRRIVAHPFGWAEPFEIKDHFVPNPGSPTDFKVANRTDDVIVLATGEKVLPGIMETALANDARCKTAIVVGQSCFEVGVLVEPRHHEETQEKFKEHIWELVQQANKQVDAHARVSSLQAIIVVPPAKTIPRSDKGSVMRQEAYRVFQDEISQMYDELDKSGENSLSPANLDFSRLEACIRDLVQKHLGWRIPADEWTDDQDLLELGMDSLQAIQLRRLLLSSLPGKDLPRDFVYQNPSVAKLARALRGDDSGHISSSGGDTDWFVRKYCTEYASPDKHVVLLTGSTGGLGSHLVQHLVSLDHVSRIFCLNRAKPQEELSSDQRVRSALSSRGIHLSEDGWTKVRVLEADGDFDQPFLGIGRDAYEEVRSQVTHIIHNGWPMDFNRRVASFESQFRITRALIDLARAARRPRTPSGSSSTRPTFLFVSSIAVVGRYPQEHGAWIVPEVPMQSSLCTDEFGYAQAKLVCERIVEHAAVEHGSEMVAKYVRVGQMTGARGSGMWNPAEHFPALVRSSQVVRALPKLRGTLSWLPVDVAAESMCELLFAPPIGGDQAPSVFHLENPVRQSWEDVLSVIQANLGISGSSHLIPYGEWVARVLELPDELIDRNPAKKMAAFFQQDFEHMSSGQVIMGTDLSRKWSKALRMAGPVDDKLIKTYLSSWRKAGFLEHPN